MQLVAPRILRIRIAAPLMVALSLMAMAHIPYIYVTYMPHISAVYTLKLKLKFLHLHLLAKLEEKVLAVMYGLPPAPAPGP